MLVLSLPFLVWGGGEGAMMGRWPLNRAETLGLVAVVIALVGQIPDWVGLGEKLGVEPARLLPQVEFVQRALAVVVAGAMVLIVASLVWRSARWLEGPLRTLGRKIDGWIRQVRTAVIGWYVGVLWWLVERSAGGDSDSVMAARTGPGRAAVAWNPQKAVDDLSDVGCEVLHKALCEYDVWGIPGVYINPEGLPSLSTTVGMVRQMETVKRACEELCLVGLLRVWMLDPNDASAWVLLPEDLWNKDLAMEMISLLQHELRMRGVWDW